MWVNWIRVMSARAFSGMRSEEHELLTDVADYLIGSDLEDVEVDCLGEWPALSDEHDVSFLD